MKILLTMAGFATLGLGYVLLRQAGEANLFATGAIIAAIVAVAMVPFAVDGSNGTRQVASLPSENDTGANLRFRNEPDTHRDNTDNSSDSYLRETSFDSDDRIAPPYNVDGTPMIGDLDLNGNFYGFTSLSQADPAGDF